MRTVSDFFKNACLNGSVENQLIIDIAYDRSSGDVVQIRNDEIVSESMKLHQSICDDSDFKFGGCIASQFEIEITRDIDLTGREITVYLFQKAIIPTYPGSQTYPTSPDITNKIITYPGFTVIEGYNGQSISIFKGKIYSCKLSKNRIIRKIVAYDDFYWKGNADCTNWYRNLFNDTEKITLGELRKAIVREAKFDQADDSIVLPADDLKVYMIEDNVTFGELLRQICEFNGCFAIINDDGELEYLFMPNRYSENYDYYIDIETEDFEKIAFTGLYITGFKDGNGRFRLFSASDENFYFMEGNNVVTANETVSNFNLDFASIQEKLKENFAIKSYTPMTLKSEYRSWVEIGDRIRVNVKWWDLDGHEQQEQILSYVLSRSISGIQAITDEISAGGENIRYTDD